MLHIAEAFSIHMGIFKQWLLKAIRLRSFLSICGILT